MRNVLITGVAGFIASNLACYLVEKYPDVFFLGIDKISYCSNVKNFEEISRDKNFKFIKADFTNLDFMDYLFSNYNIDTVLHLGAYTHVDMSFGNSIIYTQNNVVGTHVLLETAKKYNVTRFINMSTDEVYGSSHTQSDENSLLIPTNPYAASKSAAEQIARSYFHSFRLPVIVVRANNVIGPKQYPEKLLGKFILKILNGENLPIQGSGEQKRSFLYVTDVCRALEIVLQKGEIGETYNIGCKEEHSVLQVAGHIIAHFKKGDITFVEDRPFNDQRYFISSEKIEALGWTQEVSFSDALSFTIDWYVNNQNYFNS